MKDQLPTVIVRHRRENLRKCSLAGLEWRTDLLFYTYPIDRLPSLQDYLLLQIGAPPLLPCDAERGLLLIDGTWRLAKKIAAQICTSLEARSLPPGYKTAYPRKQTGCPDPASGLSSLEALYVAHRLLGKSTEGLLDHYYWKQSFLTLNEALW